MKRRGHADLDRELKHINRHIVSVSGSVPGKRSGFGFYPLLTLLVGLALVGSLVCFGPSFTGFVTFSESVTRTDRDSFSVSEPGTVRVSTGLDDINSLLISGKVYGKGKAAVFVVSPERKHLAYYFEGDAGDGEGFMDMCYDTCHLDSEYVDGEVELEFQLQGTRMDIERIRYVYGRLIDFSLEPLVVRIDYEEEPAKVFDLRLTNRELADYSVLLYIDGPLSDSFSWQGSLVHMTPEEPERIIPVTVRLPSNLPEGEYVHKVTARYVPPDTHDFVGESPVAETFVTVHN